MPITANLHVVCPWCQINYFGMEEEFVKNHFRSHIYEDLLSGQVNKKEISAQRQEQLKKHLAALLS
jgi:hypothetical protein